LKAFADCSAADHSHNYTLPCGCKYIYKKSYLAKGDIKYGQISAISRPKKVAFLIRKGMPIIAHIQAIKRNQDGILFKYTQIFMDSHVGDDRIKNVDNTVKDHLMRFDTFRKGRYCKMRPLHRINR
jgi:hypothetical protein